MSLWWLLYASNCLFNISSTKLHFSSYSVWTITPSSFYTPEWELWCWSVFGFWSDAHYTTLCKVIGYTTWTLIFVVELSQKKSSAAHYAVLQGLCVILYFLPLPLHVILVCVVLVGAETALANCILERDRCMLTADCVGGCLLHPVEECKEVSQGKSTNLSSNTLYSVNVTAFLMSNYGCTVYRWTTSSL